MARMHGSFLKELPTTSTSCKYLISNGLENNKEKNKKMNHIKPWARRNPIFYILKTSHSLKISIYQNAQKINKF
jgi:hypothetical protein